ncbi:MAG: NAD(P)/FAD-dependent oxidoreductase [Minisyncoccota bacterium]
MKKNKSPWIHQLTRNTFFPKLDSDLNTEVTIVGAGIAGISTAFFILTETNKKVILVEANKVARGATGHNAGQIVSYFERSFADIVDEFGLKKAGDAQRVIENSWELLEHMYTEAGLDIPFSRFTGHAGFSSFDQVITHLKDNKARNDAGLPLEMFLISETADFIFNIPKEYESLYKIVSHDHVMEILETKNKNFIASLSYQKGCMNSALFCEEVLMYLIKKYKDRLSIYEDTLLKKIVLKNNTAILDCDTNTIKTKKVILCTNGFENFSIFNEAGLDIDTKFHETIKGTIGYMSGYLEKMNKPPIAISYFTNKDASSEDPYFYLTRRQYEYEGNKEYNLISVGGPELSLEDKYAYSKELLYPETEEKKIDDFVRSTYETDPNKTIKYEFSWHGLMGYTTNGIRLIGFETKNTVLMYNIGCNGIGILPSIFGGKRITNLLNGDTKDMIFDPK